MKDRIYIKFPVIAHAEHDDMLYIVVRNPTNNDRLRLKMSEIEFEDYSLVEIAEIKEEPKPKKKTDDEIFSLLEDEPLLAKTDDNVAKEEVWPDDNESEIVLVRKASEPVEKDEELRDIANSLGIKIGGAEEVEEKVQRDGNDLSSEQVIGLVRIFTETHGRSQREAFIKLSRPPMSILNKMKKYIPIEIRRQIVLHKMKGIPVGPLGQGSGDIPQTFSHFWMDDPAMEREFYDMIQKKAGRGFIANNPVANHSEIEDELRHGEQELLRDISERGGYTYRKDIQSAVARFASGAAGGIEMFNGGDK